MPDDPIKITAAVEDQAMADETISYSGPSILAADVGKVATKGQISPAIYDLTGYDLSDAEGLVGRAAALGFNAVAVDLVSDRLVEAACLAELRVFLVIDLLTAASGQLVDEHPEWFAPGPTGPRFVYLSRTDPVVSWWKDKIDRWIQDGVSGFICQNAGFVPPAVFGHLIEQARLAYGDVIFLALTAGATPNELKGLHGCGFDYCTSSSCWWNFRDGWLNEESERLQRLAPVIALTSPLKQAFPAQENVRRRALALAAIFGSGWIMQSGFEDGHDFTLGSYIRELNDLRNREDELTSASAATVTSSPGSAVAMVKRGTKFVLAANPSLSAAVAFQMAAHASNLSDVGAAYATIDDDPVPIDIRQSLPPAGARLVRMISEQPIPNHATALNGWEAPRIAIEAITPKVDDGKFPVRRLVGEVVVVEADIIIDGHDKLAAEILYRPISDKEWQRRPMQLVNNDRWRGELSLSRLGRYVYAVSAWKDEYATFADEITKKHNAGVDIHLELTEGIALVQEAIEANVNGVGQPLRDIVARLTQATLDEQRVALLDGRTVALMRSGDIKKFLTQSDDIVIDAERLGARFSSWYEIFPRSQSGTADQHGTFRDVISQLPRIADMGFDVLYFPPIHPIGRKNRKGRNNTLTPAETDPGSPYAIGNEDGGHDAIHPQLGTLDEFRELITAAARYHIELALDFAIQCSPDHPWLAEHKGWFDWRPDGSLRYAENPPKKYEDIVNVDFYASGARPSLWFALRDVVQFWVDQGIKLFRVDNPHTKPLPFWEWLISDIRGRHPDVLFLAEAFTRPKMMYRLAKIGFSQSYTYFTWRNTKAELEDYLNELNRTEPKDFFGPHFFVNTPDINPAFLHHSGRAGFLIRAALAATLSGLWGVYNGFELCEAANVPGKEEYLDSEKYQIRVWDYEAPGNIVPEITRLNNIRRANKALQTHLGVEFHNANDEQVIFFSKVATDGNAMLVAICLDPFNTHNVTVELPLWRFGLPDDGAVWAEDVVHDFKFTWSGKYQPVKLHPDQPFCIWRVQVPRDGESQ